MKEKQFEYILIYYYYYVQEQVIVRKNNLKYRQCIPDFKLERNLSEDDMNKLLKKMRCLPNSKIKYMPF